MQVPFASRITISKGPEADRIASSAFGTRTPSGKLQLSLLEAYYLHEKGTITLVDGKGKPFKTEALDRKLNKLEKNFWARSRVFIDLRSRGYIVKTALKFGADFRVYERGVRPGQDHAKWIVYPVHESESFSWHDFSGKNRIAHSTRKHLMLGIVDDEGEVIYYEVRWMRP